MTEDNRNTKSDHKDRQNSVGFISSALGAEKGLALASILFLMVDVIHLVFFDQLNGFLRGLLAVPGKTSIILILSLYFLYSVSQHFNVKFAEQIGFNPDVELSKKKKRRNKRWATFIYQGSGWGFGLTIIAAVFVACGWSADPPLDLSKEWSEYPIIAGVMIFLIQVVLGAKEPRPAHEVRKAKKTSPHKMYFYLFCCILVAELMLNFSFALWFNFFSGTKPMEDSSPMFAFALLLPFFFFFYSAPRFAFLKYNFSTLNLLSGVGFMMWEIWRFAKEIQPY